MATIRIRVVAVALSCACGVVVGAKDQTVSGVASSKRMADGREWVTVKGFIVSPKVRSRWERRCAASGSDR